MAKDLPDVDMLRQLMGYDPETGFITWKKRDASLFPSPHAAAAWNSRWAGKRTGIEPTRGYCRIVVLCRVMLAHRIAWAIHHGSWPVGCVDHINGVTTDNRIENLRVVDMAGNARNAAMSDRNKSGVVGVFFGQGKWRAQIQMGGKAMELGGYPTFAEAVAARFAAQKVLGYHPNHGRKKRGHVLKEELHAD